MTRTAAAAGGSVRPRRADAERNAETILDAALEHIRNDAAVNFAAIARTAGVSRVTLYSHYPTRQDLVREVLRQSVESTDAMLRASADDNRPAIETLIDMVQRCWPIVHRYRNLQAVAAEVLGGESMRSQHSPVLDRVYELIRRGQKEGDVRSDLSVDWLVSATYGLIHTAAQESAADRLALDQIGDQLVSTVRSVLEA